MLIIEKSSLGLLTPLAKGGLGQVFRVGGYHLPNDPADLVYKEFTSELTVQAKSAQAAVAYRDGLKPAEQAELDAHAAWPRALVEEPKGTVKGLLMPLIPADFFCRMEDPDTGALTDRPLEMGWLAASSGQRTAAQVALREVSKLERLILLGWLIYAIGRLHKYGWVFGDLSLRNAVFALDPPRVMLVDCDGTASQSNPARRQGQTPHWDPPECPLNGTQQLQYDTTDVYKLGLAVLRCLVPGKGATTARDPAGLRGVLDTEGATLITRALGVSNQRPRAKELYDYFQRTVAALVRPPEITMARLRHPVRVRGMDVRIDWQISNASTVTVIAGRQRIQVDLTQRPDGYTFRPDESGPVAIEVANRFGTIPRDLGDVTLYELPQFKVDFDYLPMPQVPSLPTISMTALDRVIAAAPTVRLPEIPAVPALDTFGLVQSLMQSAALTVPLPQFGVAVVSATAAVSATLQAQANQVGASVRTAYLASQGHTGKTP